MKEILFGLWFGAIIMVMYLWRYLRKVDSECTYSLQCTALLFKLPTFSFLCFDHLHLTSHWFLHKTTWNILKALVNGCMFWVAVFSASYLIESHVSFFNNLQTPKEKPIDLWRCLDPQKSIFWVHVLCAWTVSCPKYIVSYYVWRFLHQNELVKIM